MGICKPYEDKGKQEEVLYFSLEYYKGNVHLVASDENGYRKTLLSILNNGRLVRHPYASIGFIQCEDHNNDRIVLV